MPQPDNIILVGFMASGKSHVGRILSQRTGRPLGDADAEITARAGKSIDRIFADAGESAFRALEREVIGELCAGSGRIIAAGGGAFVDLDNRRAMLAAGAVFCLSAQPETIYQRLAAGQSVRPLLAGDNPAANNPAASPAASMERIRELLAQRADAYRQAHHRIDTDHLTPEQVAERVLELIDIEGVRR